MRQFRLDSTLFARAARVLSATIFVLAATCGYGWSQSGATAASASSVASSGWLRFANPPQFSLLLFGGGFLSTQYGSTQQGFQAEQSVTEYVGLVARAAAYQLYIGPMFDNPGSRAAGIRPGSISFARRSGSTLRHSTGPISICSGGATRTTAMQACWKAI